MNASYLNGFFRPATRTIQKVVRSKYAKFMLLIVGLLWGYIYHEPILNLVALVRDREGLIENLSQYGAAGPILLAVVISLQVFVAAIPGHLLIITGGYLYGFWGGFLLTYLTTVLSSQAAFHLARFYGKAVVEKLVNSKELDKWERVAEKQGFDFFLFTMLIPVFPVDVMAYVAGMGTIKSQSFAIVNLISRIPVAIALTLVGSHGLEVSWQTVLIATLVSLGMFLYVRRFSLRFSVK